MKRILCMITALLIAASPLMVNAEEVGVPVTLDATDVTPSPAPTQTPTPTPSKSPSHGSSGSTNQDNSEKTGEIENLYVPEETPDFPSVWIEWVEITPEAPDVIFTTPAPAIQVTIETDATALVPTPSPTKNPGPVVKDEIREEPEREEIKKESVQEEEETEAAEPEEEHMSIAAVIIVSLIVSLGGGLAGIYISKRLYKRQ